MSAARDGPPFASVLWAGPLLLSVLAFGWLAIANGTATPWSAVVHEDNQRTLALTILYPRHLLRELPVALLYVAAVAAAVGTPLDPPRGWRAWVPLGVALVLVGAAAIWVVHQYGRAVALADLGQFHTHDTRGAAGAHWGAHYGSNLAFVAAAWVLATPWRSPDGARWPMALLALAGMLSAVGFGFRLEAVLAPRAAAHQAREILTHVSVTLPLALYCVTAGGRVSASAPDLRRPVTWDVVAAALVTVALGGLLALVALGGDALAEAPATWRARLAAHLFEHGLDITLVAALCLGLRASRPSPAAARRAIAARTPPARPSRPG